MLCVRQNMTKFIYVANIVFAKKYSAVPYYIYLLNPNATLVPWSKFDDLWA